MDIICKKLTNEVVGISEHIDYNDNGYPYIPETDTCFILNHVYVVKDVLNIPDNFSLEYQKYCFNSEKSELYVNPVYKDPFTLSETEYTSLRSDMDYLMLLNDPDSASE